MALEILSHIEKAPDLNVPVLVEGFLHVIDK